MARPRAQEYLEKYADQLLRITPFALKKTGLIQSQAFLKIEDYTLICAPFQLSMKRGIFLVVLSAQEIAFFQQFQKRLCSINLTFQKSGSKRPLTLFLRGTLERIGPVKGRQSVCIMDAAIKACPNDMVEIIGDYMVTFESLKSRYDSFRGKAVAVDDAAAKLMRFNNYVELIAGNAKTRASLLSLSVNSLTLELPAIPPGLAQGTACSAKLYFQIYQFSANGKVTAIDQEPGRVKITLEIEFTPELIEILDDYFFRQTIQGRRAAQPAG